MSEEIKENDTVQGMPEQKAPEQAEIIMPHRKKLMEYTEYGSPGKRPTWIRVVCIIAVVLLVGLIIATLIAAIAGAGRATIMALILCDGIIPIFVWVFLKITQRSLDRRKGAEKYYGQNQN